MRLLFCCDVITYQIQIICIQKHCVFQQTLNIFITFVQRPILYKSYTNVLCSLCKWAKYREIFFFLCDLQLLGLVHCMKWPFCPAHTSTVQIQSTDTAAPGGRGGGGWLIPLTLRYYNLITSFCTH